MKTTKTQETPSKVRLSIEATPEEVAPALERAFDELSREVKVPGFRKGKVPRRILEARLQPDAIREAALREAIPMLLTEAVKDEDLLPVAPPSVDVSGYEVGGTLTLEATVEVRPEINLPDLGALVVSKPASTVGDAELDEQIARLRERFATLETVSRPLERNDYALIDLRTYVHDTTVEDATATDLMYEVGSERFVTELDHELEGKRAGDILKFNAVLPEQMGGEHGGKEVSMQVLVKEAKRKVLPQLDDEFAKTASEFETLEELREDVRKRLEEAKDRQADLEVRTRLLEQLVDSTEIVPPDSFLREELQYRATRLAQQLAAAGMTVEQYLEAAGKTEEDLQGELRADAERNVKAQLVLEEVARREELSITPEELEEEVRRHAQELRVEADELRKSLERNERLSSLAGDILRRKALELIVGRADIRSEDS